MLSNMVSVKDGRVEKKELVLVSNPQNVEVQRFTSKQAEEIGRNAGINFEQYNLDQFTKGYNVELEHKDLTNGDPMMTAKIVIAHLNEDPKYYDKLEKVEAKDGGPGSGIKGHKTAKKTPYSQQFQKKEQRVNKAIGNLNKKKVSLKGLKWEPTRTDKGNGFALSTKKGGHKFEIVGSPYDRDKSKRHYLAYVNGNLIGKAKSKAEIHKMMERHVSDSAPAKDVWSEEARRKALEARRRKSANQARQKAKFEKRAKGMEKKGRKKQAVEVYRELNALKQKEESISTHYMMFHTPEAAKALNEVNRRIAELQKKYDELTKKPSKR